MQDGEIIRLYRSGEEERAFSEIVRSYSERLYWHVRRFVYCHEDADDLVQEIFVKIWAALPSSGGGAALYMDIPHRHQRDIELSAETEGPGGAFFQEH